MEWPRGIGAFDHQFPVICGAFEQHFCPGSGKFNHKISKSSNAQGMPGGGGDVNSID
jgi:hypothetical protein